jgi:hypothetical protein
VLRRGRSGLFRQVLLILVELLLLHLFSFVSEPQAALLPSLIFHDLFLFCQPYQLSFLRDLHDQMW